jgi:hypothetical protein
VVHCPAGNGPKGVGPDRIKAAVAVDPLVHETGIAQHLEVTRDRRAADRAVGGEVTCGQLSLCHQAFDNGQARGIGEGGKGFGQAGHDLNLTKLLN